VLWETHSHTELCKHAVGEPEAYTEQALRAGLRGLTVTCHCPLPNGLSRSIRMDPEQFDSYLALVARAQKACGPNALVLLGLECDYLPGTEDFVEALLKRADYDYILGSVHPHIQEYRLEHYRNDWPAFHRGYFQHLAESAETGLFDCLAHPDIVKNLGSKFWDLPALMPDIQRALDRIARTGKAMELNTSGLNKTVPEMNPAPSILREIARRGIPIVIGADAHEPARVGDRFPQALELLRACGFEKVSLFRARQRLDIPVETALASFASAAGA
jgi:histidinol-phosphatase (PHP family)